MKKSVLLFVIAATCARADTVYLLNGNQMSGRIVSMSADPVVLELENGKISFSRSEISDMELDDQGYQGEPPESANAGDPASIAAAAQRAPSVADLPPPATPEEVARRYDMVSTAINKLTMNREENGQEDLDRREDYIRALGQLGPSVAPKIEDTFHHGDVRAAGALLSALNLADPGRAQALAKEAIHHVHPEARETAIAIIAASEDKEKAALLSQALADPRALNRMAALRALGEVKDAKSAAAVAKLVADGNPDVQAQAVATMQAITGEKLAKPEEWTAWAAAHAPADPGVAPVLQASPATP